MKSTIKRRAFLKKLATGSAVTTVPAVAASLVAQQKDSFQQQVQQLRQRLEEAENSVEQLKKDHKKTVKAAAIVTGVLVGIDLSLML